MHKLKDFIPGGKGDTKNISDFNIYEFEIGKMVEMEHTTDKKVAIDIVKDHLAENPNYYSELIESGLVDEKKAVTLYKKYKDKIHDGEAEKLKDEYYSIKRKPFVNNDDLKRMEEIGRELNSKYKIELPKDENEWNMDKNKSSSVKFKKSKRVTPFTRDRR